MGQRAATSAFNVLIYNRLLFLTSNPITTMTILKQSVIAFLIGISSFWNSLLFAADRTATTTEEECARLQDAEIVWDLSKYRWMCCIIKNEDEYETCMPITDMKPLPKKNLKPFPPNTTKTIKPQNQQK
jgi:hypothetical protein